MAKSKILLDTTEGKGFSKRKVTEDYAIDLQGNILDGVTPMYRVGVEYYGHDAIQRFFDGKGQFTSSRNIIIQHHPDDPSFPQNSSGWSTDDDGYVLGMKIIHPSNFSTKSSDIDTGNQQINDAINTVLTPVQDAAEYTEDFLEREISGFKIYQLVIVGLVTLLIIK